MFIAAIVCAGICSSAVAQLYAVSPFTGNASLYRLDTSTGAPTLVAPLSDANLNVAGIDFDNAGRLLATDSFRLGGGASRQVWEISTTTGALTSVVNFNDGGVYFEGGLGIDPTTNLAYFSILDSISRVDLTTGSVTSLGHVTLNGASIGGDGNIDGLAFRGGDLYGIVTIQSSINGHLVRIDKNTLALTDIGATGLSIGGVAGLAYDPGADVFYLSGESLPGLYRVNPTNAAVTLIGNHNLPNLSGLAFIPEPTALGLCSGLTMVLLIARRRRM